MVEQRLLDNIDHIAEKAINDPLNSSSIIKQEGRKIASNANSDISKKTKDNIVKVVEYQKNEVKNQKMMKKRIEKDVSYSINIKVNRLIGQLTSSDETVRFQASYKLSSLGPQLSNEQVKRVINKFKNSRGSWSEFLYREHHCRWFRYTNKNVYAAKALESMNSKYISDNLREDVRVAISNGVNKRRVTDPGWI